MARETQRSAPDPELGRQIVADLRYISDRWGAERIDDDALRRDSVILRRLLVDNGGGILRTYRKQRGHRGDVKVEAVDLKAQLSGLDRKLIRIATAGGATHAGISVAGCLRYAAAFTPEQVKQRYDGGLKMERLGLARYLDATCLVVESVSVGRRVLIQYIGNRMGGVHYDPNRDPDAEKAFIALDDAMGTMNLAEKDAVYFELLAIGQTLIASPDISPWLDRQT